MNPTHTYTRDIVFGDCDPAGIVYYPNIYAWMDGTFHHYLLQFGGHQVVCEAVGSVGFGLFETRARYERALRIGDRLSIEMRIVEWARKTVTVAYRGVVDGHVAHGPLLAAADAVRGDGMAVVGHPARRPLPSGKPGAARRLQPSSFPRSDEREGLTATRRHRRPATG